MVFRVFFGNLSYKLNDKTFSEELSKLNIANFSEAKIITMKSGLSLGFGFVTFEKEEDAKKAIAENGKEMSGRKIKVEMAFDEKTVQERREKRINSNKNVFVGGFPENATQEDLEKIFSDVKPVSCNLIVDSDKKCKGFGFASFKTHEEADEAIKTLKGTKVNNKELVFQFARPIRNRRGGFRRGFASKKSASKSTPKKTEKPRNLKARKPREPIANREKDELVVFVGSISFKAEEKDLMEFFKAYNPKEVHITKRRSGLNWGYGFVTFNTAEDAKKALELNGKTMMERTIKCDIAYKKIEPKKAN